MSRILIVAACVAVSFAGCTHKTVTQAPTVGRPIPLTGDHWVQGETLRELMDSLAVKSGSMHEVSGEDFVRDAGRTGDLDYEEAIRLGQSLAASAVEIPNLAESADLTPADRRAFRAQAQMLRDEALEFASAAEQRNDGRLRTAMDAMYTTCHTCHLRFRDLSGLLAPRRQARAVDPDRPSSNPRGRGRRSG